MTMTSARVIRFTVPGRPVAAVRMTRRGIHTPQHRDRKRIDAYLAYRDRVGWAAKQHGAEPLTGRLYARLWVYLDKRGRQDCDNIAKAILDGAAGVCFHNDVQIDDLRVCVYRGQPGEYVDVEIGQLVEREVP